MVVNMQWCIISIAVTCCTPWGGSLGYVNHPGNLYPFKLAVWTAGRSRRGCGVVEESYLLLVAFLFFDG
jgi:hypothetical protein